MSDRRTSVPSRNTQTLFNPAYRRAKEDERFAATPQQYFRQHNIDEYITDAICLLSESNDRKPLDYLMAYFQNVLSGDNVLFRDFQYVQLTPRNRRSFIRQLRETYQHFDIQQSISVESLHQLICLLCPDFPVDFLHCAHQLLRHEPGDVPFGIFTQHAYILFYFGEFMREAARIFRVLDEQSTGSVPRIIFLDALVDVDIPWPCPCPDTLKASLSINVEDAIVSMNTTFEAFCNVLFKDERITAALIEPRTYTELRANIERLLQTLTPSSEVNVAPTKKKGRRSNAK